MKLTPDQISAVDQLVDYAIAPSTGETTCIALAGPSGSGKSTTMKFFLDELDALNKGLAILDSKEGGGKGLTITGKLVLTASTNKAAAVLSAMTGKPASTIHSLLRLTVRPNFSTGKEDLVASGKRRVDNCTIIIDEASMIDDKLMQFLDERTSNCKIIFVGDDHQLKPVGSNHMPAFAIDDVIHLSTIMRQKDTSFIRTIGNEFRKSIFGNKQIPTTLFDGLDVINCDGPTFQQEVDKVFGASDYKSSHGRILCRTNDLVHEYNSYVRNMIYGSEALNIHEELIVRSPIHRDGQVAHSIEEVVKISSVNEVTYKGVKCSEVRITSSHIIARVPHDNTQVKQLIKQAAARAKAGQDTWAPYFNLKEEFHDLRPVYSGTTHTSQGSTYDTVFINLNDLGGCWDKEELLRLLYVAFTRAKHKVFIYGSL